MIKPLLKVIPALSGNVKLGCEVNRYEKISDNVFAGISRNGRLYPLSNESFTQVIDVSFLNGAWEYDISKFYNSGYSDIFFKDTFKFDKNNLLYINNTASVIQDRNTDIEFGCKRVSFAKTGYQFAFFAPIYCDNVNDLPDYFEITITFNKHDLGGVTKKIRVQLSDEYKYNYLNLYLTRYLSKIDDNVIYMLPDSSQALYYGIDVWLGGFNQYVDNLISKIYTEETTINGYDACISDGFRRNNLIMRQILPLAFYFNVNDILTEKEQILFKNAYLHIKGQYWKNGSEINFFMFDDNYTELNLPTLKLNTNGELEYQYIHNNLLSFTDNTAIRTDNVFEYRFSNKLNKTYNRWKLKYSTDEYPYITNTNYNFSKNQDLYNLYYQYPQHYYWSSLLCNIIDNEVNLILPIGENIDKYYNNNIYLLNKYNLAINNYISNWFDVTADTSIDYILANTDWGDVHKDNKIFYKGLLYNFNEIYKTNNVSNTIDKFAVLFHINTDLYTNDTINQYVSSKYVLETTKTNNIVVNLHSYNLQGDFMQLSQLYTIENFNTEEPNFTVKTNQHFTYNAKGEGKFVELEDLGFDFYEKNKYYKISDVLDTINTTNEIKQLIYTFSIDGFELSDISYISNIINNNQLIIDSNNDSLYFSYNNTNIKNTLNNIQIQTDLSKETQFSYTFFSNQKFISNFNLYNIFNSNINVKHYLAYFSDLTTFLYYPQYLRSNNKIVYDVFKEIDNHNKFYGDHTDVSHINIDNDVLYVDPYNIKDKLDNNYTLLGNVYIKDINVDDKYIVLSNITNTTNIQLYTDIVGYDKYDYTYALNELFDTNNTYANQEKFSYSKYNVNTLISEINNISLKYHEIDDTYYYHYSNESPIVIVKNEYKTNIYNHNSIITGYFYVSNINKDELSITLSNYANDTLNLYFNNIDELLHYGYKANAITKIEGSYINNQNGYGTYMFTYSYIFKHPAKLISNIYNLSYIDECNLPIISHYDFNIIDYDKYVDYSYYNMTIYNPSDDTSVFINKNTFDESKNSIVFGRFLNITHIKVFNKFINEYALNKDNEVISENYDNILDYIYIKETFINDNLTVKYKYTPLSDIDKFNNITVDDIYSITNYLFSINGAIYELYFKKSFIKITKQIFDNVVRLNTNEYNDLYIYTLSNINEHFSSINYKYVKTFDSTYYSSSYSLTPLFNDVYKQEQTNTVIYKSYILNNISDVRFIDKTSNNSYTLFRYNNFDKLCMVDVSYINDILSYTSKALSYTYTNCYIYRPLSYISYSDYSNNEELLPTFIYNSIKENIETYSYSVDSMTVIDTDIKISYFSCYSTNIPTYDNIADVTSKYLNVGDNGIDFSKYKLNTYTYNGTTYGFYLKELSLKNLNSMFNITFNNYEPVNYFTRINGISIINNDKYITNIFKLLLPCIKYNIISDLYDLSVLNTQFKTTFNKRYINYNDNGVNHIIFDDNRMDKISLYRYYDSIVPYIKETSNIPTEYYIKTTQLKQLLVKNNLYTNDITNIYFYDGIRNYTNDIKYTVFKQLENKYYNDNNYINLETEFEIFVSNNLTEIELLHYQEHDVILTFFEKYINKFKHNKFNDNEILFLYNKYKIILLSNPVKLNNNYTNKIYTLTYKFSLR